MDVNDKFCHKGHKSKTLVAGLPKNVLTSGTNMHGVRMQLVNVVCYGKKWDVGPQGQNPHKTCKHHVIKI